MLTPTGLWDELRREYSLREDYAGRGANGRTSVALVGDERDLFKFAARVTSLGEDYDLDAEDLAYELADRVAVDSIGTSTIYYFPGVAVEDAENR